MPLKFITQLNWVDILVLILIFRVCYISLRTGLVIEFFKLFGTLAAIYLSLHYYPAVSGMIKDIPGAKYISFFALSAAGYAVFLILRIIFHRFIKMEAVPRLDRWGGLVLGIIRACLLTGWVLFVFLFYNQPYLTKSVGSAYFGSRMSRVAPETYSWLWNSIISKFMVNEKFNKAAVEELK